MSDVKEALEMMKEVAKTRIAMLKKGMTFHNEQDRVFYIREYQGKLRKIEDIIRRMNIRIIHKESDEEYPDNDLTT